MPKMQIEYIPVDCIQPYERNAKKHPPEQVEQIANSIREFGFKQPLVVDAKNVLVIGHGRLMAAKLLEMVEVPCVRADDLTPEQIKALRLADNKLNESDWDMALLEIELADISKLDMADFGFDLDEDDYMPAEENKGSMASKYLVPPFSVIYGNKSDWLKRKRAWVDKGIRSELGRGGGLTFNVRSDWQTTGTI